jgi:RNA polymerase sigma-70 factor (ECF subfamily)
MKDIQHIGSDLFARLAQGDEEAFTQIVHFFYKKMLPIAISLVRSETVARDIMQDVFLKLWLNRALMTTIENPAAWLNVVVANTTSNYIRAQLRYDLRVKHSAADAPDTEEIWTDLDARFTKSLIDEAISELPAKRKLVFLLSRREGLSRKEIACKLNISENTVRNQLTDAIQFIQEHLRSKGVFLIPSVILLQNWL